MGVHCSARGTSSDLRQSPEAYQLDRRPGASLGAWRKGGRRFRPSRARRPYHENPRSDRSMRARRRASAHTRVQRRHLRRTAVRSAPRRLIADKGYDANSLRRTLETQKTEAVIPSTTSRKRPIPYAPWFRRCRAARGRDPALEENLVRLQIARGEPRASLLFAPARAAGLPRPRLLRSQRHPSRHLHPGSIGRLGCLRKLWAGDYLGRSKVRQRLRATTPAFLTSSRHRLDCTEGKRQMKADVRNVFCRSSPQIPAKLRPQLASHKCW